MTSCHHGDVRHQNNLEYAKRVLERYNAEIAIMEIDFVQWGEKFLSSHDYQQESIQQGSPLVEWIAVVVIKYNKTLWLDLKSQHDVITLMGWCGSDTTFKFDARALLKSLNAIRKTLNRRIEERIWISCQDEEVKESLIYFNGSTHTGHQRWRIVNDIPFISSYIWKYFLPLSALHLYVRNAFLTYNYEGTVVNDQAPVICIDRSFFPDSQSLVAFIEESSIPTHSILILYTYQRSEPKITLAGGYTVVMQYDYTSETTNSDRSKIQ
jgi:hypothetical protein